MEMMELYFRKFCFLKEWPKQEDGATCLQIFRGKSIQKYTIR